MTTNIFSSSKQNNLIITMYILFKKMINFMKMIKVVFRFKNWFYKKNFFKSVVFIAHNCKICRCTLWTRLVILTWNLFQGLGTKFIIKLSYDFFNGTPFYIYYLLRLLESYRYQINIIKKFLLLEHENWRGPLDLEMFFWATSNTI